MVEFKEVHSDERRTIYADETLLDGREISIIKLNKGKAIGGCYHTCWEHMCVLDGQIFVKIGNMEAVFKTGDSFSIPPLVPHLFWASKDSLVMEWGVTTEDKKNDNKHPDMRAYVNRVNKGLK